MHQPVGYYYEYSIYHPACFPKGVDPNGEEVQAIFAWEKDAFAVCDHCCEPLLEHEEEEDGY